MRRFSTLIVVMGLVLLVLVAPASAGAHQSASVSPSSGLAGSVVTVSIADFTPGSTFEVHSGSYSGGLLASGTTNSSGSASVGVTIPAGASPGPFTLAVCETQFVACIPTNPPHEFWVGAQTTFNVSIPPPVVTIPTTTATIPTVTPTVTAPPPEVTPAGPCVIPDGAIRIDFDDLPTGLANAPEIYGPLSLDEFYLWQLDHVTVNPDGTRSGSGPVSDSGGPDISDSAALTRDTDPYTWLGSSSPPNVLRAIDEANFSVVAYRALPAEMDYFGFNLGFGHYSEGFDRPEYVQYDVSVRLLPMYELDGTITEAAWDPVTVTLGPGPQAVTTCVLLENTDGVTSPFSTWLIDVVPRQLDGSPLHLILEMDDVFYGTNGAAAAVAPDAADETTTTTSEPIVATTAPPSEGESDSGSDFLLVLLSGLGGLFVGGGAIWLLRRRGA